MTEYGKITISRPSSNQQVSGWIEISVRNNKSKVVFQSRIELQQFAQAVTGMAMVPCEFTIVQVEREGRAWNHVA